MKQKTGLSAGVRRAVNLASVIHPFPVATVVLTSTFLLIIAQHGRVDGTFTARAILVVLLSQIAVGAYNDYHDRFQDARTQVTKPIPSGRVTARAAAGLTIIALVMFVPFAASFGWIAFCLSVLGLAAGLAYDRWLKPTPLSILGYLIGFLALVTWIWYVAGPLPRWFPLLYVLAPFILITAHLAQSFPDIETDRELGQRGLAVALGAERTLFIIMTFYSAALLAMVAVTVHARYYPALALEAASFVVASHVARLRPHCLDDRGVRLQLFHRGAVALGTLVLAGVLTVAQ